MGAKTARPNRESVVFDVEGGTISSREAKAAREVAETAMTDREFTRLANRIVDETRDSDSSLTRATRDRDRATPRDTSHVDSARLSGELPAVGEFRSALSGRQRKIRSAAKNRVIGAAPASQRQAIHSMLVDEDPGEWRRINGALHHGAGDAQALADGDRAKVQRLDRVVQSYERENDRTHTVYFAVKLPDTHSDVKDIDDVPDNLRPGAKVTFDQFTIARHNLHEVTGHDSDRYLMVEMATNRGMYFGHSDSMEDTTHVLPRGMSCEVAATGHTVYEDSGGYEERIILQLREQQK